MYPFNICTILHRCLFFVHHVHFLDFMTHLKMLFAVAVLFFGGTYYSSTLTPTTTDRKPNMQQSLANVINKLDQMVFATIPPPIPKSWIDSPNRSEEWKCDILLAQSSIPNSVFGVFTREDLKEGDEIFANSLMVSIQDGLRVPLHLPLFKHHSVYANVKVNESFAIVATDSIQAGSELFINMDDDSLNPIYREYYQRHLYPNDPNVQDYLEADALVKDLFDVLPTRPDRKAGRRTGRQAALMRQIPSVDAGPLLKVYRKHIQKYNPKAATLIPVDMNEARNMLEAGSSQTFISNVRSLDWLKNHSLCLDGLRAGKSTFANDAMGTFATRSVSAGDVISTVPLIATADGNFTPNCFQVDDTVYLCPLSFAAFIQAAVDGCSNEEECPMNVANAMYQFSSFNGLNEERFNLLKGNDLLKVSPSDDEVPLHISFAPTHAHEPYIVLNIVYIRIQSQVSPSMSSQFGISRTVMKYLRIAWIRCNFCHLVDWLILFSMANKIVTFKNTFIRYSHSSTHYLHSGYIYKLFVIALSRSNEKSCIKSFALGRFLALNS